MIKEIRREEKRLNRRLDKAGTSDNPQSSGLIFDTEQLRSVRFVILYVVMLYIIILYFYYIQYYYTGIVYQHFLINHINNLIILINSYCN